MLNNDEIEVKYQGLFILGHLCGVGYSNENLQIKIDDDFFK